MMKPKTMIVAGVMSGTSADGVDVALCRIAAGKETPRIQLLGTHSLAYSKPLRNAVLAAMDAKSIPAADLSRLNWRLGEVYAEAVGSAVEKHQVKLDLVGCHGQTLYHQGAASIYLGKPVRATWQTGESSVIAERLRTQGAKSVSVRVVENADPAAAINRLAREEQVDFVAMTTRGSSGLKRFVLGSVAERVVRDSNVAVLASGSLSHRFNDNGSPEESIHQISREFFRQVDLRVVDLWRNGDWKTFCKMLPEYADLCEGEGGMHDTAMLLGLLGWDAYDRPVEIVTDYFCSSGTGQINAVFPLPGAQGA